MRGINFQSMLKNWDSIIHKLCEEVSTHDVLEIVKNHIQLMVEEFNKNKLNSSKIEEALNHVSIALELLNPEK
jgi:glucan phosphorylase